MVPNGTEALTEAARISDPDAIAWRGDVSLPPQERCVNVLGTPKVREIHIGSSLGARPSDVTDSGNVRSPVRVDYVALFSNNTAKLHVEGGASHFECGVCSLSFASDPQSTRGATMQHVLGRRQPSIFTKKLTASKHSSDHAAIWASWADSLHTIEKRHAAVKNQIWKTWCVMDSWRLLGRVWQKAYVQCDLLQKTNSLPAAKHAHLVRSHRRSWAHNL